MKRLNRAALAVLALGFAAAVASAPSLAAGAFEGVWKVADTGGTAFEITLGADGKASATRSGEGMTGTWTEVGESAVITWDTGWTTVISKEGDKFMKSAFDKGKALDGEPDNSSAAEKVK